MLEHADGTFCLADNQDVVKLAVSPWLTVSSTFYIKVLISGINITFNIHQIVSIGRHPKAGRSALLKLSSNILLEYTLHPVNI